MISNSSILINGHQQKIVLCGDLQFGVQGVTKAEGISLEYGLNGWLKKTTEEKYMIPSPKFEFTYDLLDTLVNLNWFKKHSASESK